LVPYATALLAAAVVVTGAAQQNFKVRLRPVPIEASTAAMKLIEGPRRLTVLSARADIYAAMGDAANAKKTIEDAVAYAKSLPEGQRSERRIAAFEKRLASMK
jgi:hypothetical protein